MMEHEVVRKRGWITERAFFGDVSRSHLGPGPNASNLPCTLATSSGYPASCTGTSFILPSFVATVAVLPLCALRLTAQTAAIFYILNPLVLA
jgi:chromate transport protein ChrA